MKIARKEDIYRIDKACLEDFGIPVLLLMENAGEAVYRFIKEKIPDYHNKKYLIICGTGNNGGDGAAAARKLFLDGCTVHVVFTDNINKSKGEAKINFDIIQKIKVPVSNFSGNKELRENEEELKGITIRPSKPALSDSERGTFIREYDVIIDAIFGIGFHGEVDSNLAIIINEINLAKKTVVAVDIPSGVYADGGSASTVIKANFTITLGIPKLGLIDFPGRDYAGEIHTYPINIPSELLKNEEIKINLITPEDLKEMILPRKRNSHKGTFGHLLIIGGFEGNSESGIGSMSGAVILAGMASLRTGIGLLTIAVPEDLIKSVQCSLPEAMTLALRKDSKKTIQILQEFIRKRGIKSVLIGNGFGTGQYQRDVILSILEEKTIEKLVIDADGLNNISENPEILEKIKNSQKEIILTPHIGEMARLMGIDNTGVKSNKIESAREFSSNLKVITILKDSISIIASTSNEVWINDRGSSSLAKGGSGDILAGIIAGLLTAGYTSLHSAILGSYILGRAGEIYEIKNCSLSALARDIIDLLPEVWKEITTLSF